MVGREPCSQGLAGRLPETAQLRAPPRHVRGFVEQDQVEREVVQVVAATVQVCRSTLDRLVRDRRLKSSGGWMQFCCRVSRNRAPKRGSG